MTVNDAHEVDPAGADVAGAMPVDELGARIVDLAGRLTAATCRWLLLVAHFDAREGYLSAGLASTAQWLAFTCGIAHRTAVEHVRVSRALAAQPRLAAEMSAGRLSYSQVRAITRVADPGDHQLAESLIDAAQHGTIGQLETLVRGLRTVDDNDKTTEADPAEYVHHSWTSDSRLRLTARLDPERGALIVAAVDAVAQREGMTQADALVRLAEIGLAALADNDDAPRGLRGDERAAVVISLDVAQLPPASAETDSPQSTGADLPQPRSAERDPTHQRTRERPYARIVGGPGLPDRVVQRLLCASRVRVAVRDGHGPGSHVLDVGRSQRLVTDRQYRALLLRQQGHCAHPGCPNTKNLDAHHRIHWLHGGRTDLANLLLLCERHHVAHHEGKFRIIALPNSRFRFIRSDGRDLGLPPGGTARGDTARLEDEFADVAPTAATTHWGRPAVGSALRDQRSRTRTAAARQLGGQQSLQLFDVGSNLIGGC